MCGIKDLFGPEEYKVMSERQLVAIRKISGYIQQLREDFHDLVEARKEANKIESYPERAMIYSNTVLPYMESIRKIVDKLEMVVDDELWPLPKYRELLFLR